MALSPDEQRRLDALERQLGRTATFSRVTRRLGRWRVPVAVVVLAASTVSMVALLAVGALPAFGAALGIVVGASLLVPEPASVHPAVVAARLRRLVEGDPVAEDSEPSGLGTDG